MRKCLKNMVGTGGLEPPTLAPKASGTDFQKNGLTLVNYR